MNKETWLQICSEAFELSKLQQKTYRAGRGDNGKRTPRDLYVSDVFWKYQAILAHQLFKLVESLITSTSVAEKTKRRIRFLSVVVTFLDRFVSLPGEGQELVDGKSIIQDRGVEHS